MVISMPAQDEWAAEIIKGGGGIGASIFTYLDSKLEETHTEKANRKGKFCGAIKCLPLLPRSSSATEKYANFWLSHFLAFAQWP